MKIHKIAWAAGVLALAAWLAAVAPPDSRAQEDREGVEVLARGPLHEAYASPLDSQPKASALVPKEPPAPIEEEPPDQKPEGDNVVWIPGYWAWDTETTDFLWVSGFWREAPPGRRWVAGNWQKESDEGWRWVSGFWVPEQQEELAYVPPPPQSLERGPVTPEPEVSSDYIPGCWVWRETRHVWRPGFWLAHRPDWVWNSPHYVWSPAGCVFVEGFWDHPLHERGLLFAPIRVERRLLARNFTYRPSYVIPADALLGALFVRPSTHQYHFGDYFGARDQKAGFVPWVDYRPARNVRDANFNYYHVENAGERRWEESLRGLYTARQKGEIAPPPRTLVQQTTVVQKLTVQKTQNVTVNKTVNLTNIKNVTMLAPLKRIDNSAGTVLAALAHPSGTPVKEVEAKKIVKLQTINVEQRKQVVEHTTKIREVAVQRKQVEEKARAMPPIKTGDAPRVIKFNLPKPPAPVTRPPETTAPRKTAPPHPTQVPHIEPKPKGTTPPVTPPPKGTTTPVTPPKVVPPPTPVTPPPPPKVVPPPPPPPKVVPPPTPVTPPPPPKVTPPPPAPPPKVVPPPPPKVTPKDKPSEGKR